MRNPLSKTPFLFLLIPLVAGALLQYYFEIKYGSIVLFLSGCMAMLFSYFVPLDKQFSLRWVFGLGACLFVMGIGMFSTSLRQQKSSFVFSSSKHTYRGIVIDIPQEKPRSIAYKVRLPDIDRQIVCYISRDSTSGSRLSVGDEFIFRGKIVPFQNRQNAEFDYVRYMYNKGFVGWAYLDAESWHATGARDSSLKITALKYRQHLLDFYKSLGFSDTEYAILSALTLGYQDALSDDLKQGFRTTGTVHVLSVSGLHVGIIYLIISSLFVFIPRSSKYYRIKPLFVIAFLWLYAFVTGLSPSVIRASAMLSVFCASELFARKSYSIHALCIAIFFMVLLNPFILFDIGFQLSILSVWSILYLHPKLNGLWKVKHVYVRRIWQMFNLSLVAQLATFPLCLYYFGTFPTYFFLTNLLIVPLVSLIMYAMGGVYLAKLLSFVIPVSDSYLYYLPVNAAQLLIKSMTACIVFFEKLPYALVEDINISFIDLLLIFTFIWGTLFYLIHKKTKLLIGTLSIILALLSVGLYFNLFNY